MKENPGHGFEPTIAVSRDVAIITVQYRNPADTAAFLQSLAALDNAGSCEVIVVDNSPPIPPSVAERVADGAPFAVRTIESRRNLYYWGGAAFAMAAMRRMGGRLPRWVIVCNNDVTIVDAKFLTRLATIDPVEFPIVAPAIHSLSSGRDQNPILEAFPGFLKRLKWKVYDAGYPVAKTMLAIHRIFVNKASGATRPTQGTRRTIYAPHGAFVILSSAFFERGGTLDTEVAMFAEELTIAETARQLGMPIWYFPDLEVRHAEHSTTGANLTREKYALERMARRRYYSMRRTVQRARDWQLDERSR